MPTSTVNMRAKALGILREMPNLRDRMELISKCGIKLISDARPEHRIKSYDTSANTFVSL